MDLSELRDGHTVHDSARRAAGMVVVRRLRIKVESSVLERVQKILYITLHIEKRQWTRFFVASFLMKPHAGRLGAAGCSKADPLQLLGGCAGGLEDITCLEQAHIVASPIEIV